MYAPLINLEPINGDKTLKKCIYGGLLLFGWFGSLAFVYNMKCS